MDKDKVLALSKLSRIKVSEEEAESLSAEFGSILGYVGEVKAISASEPSPKPADFPVRNVMREDGLGHEPGIYTEKILNEAPSRDGAYLKVKKIL
jgi:aspartyl-tRNA(Asn)/glutamyl-tRNA(Gln) amidotransferase subunit C